MYSLHILVVFVIVVCSSCMYKFNVVIVYTILVLVLVLVLNTSGMKELDVLFVCTSCVY